uniref:YeiH family protein n=1 Tax=Castellaniella defragrans TaxID=75697 RepID=UPI0033410966
MPPISAIPQTLHATASAWDAGAGGQHGRSPSRLHGLALAAVLGLLAWRLGVWLPLIGGPVLGILLGMAWRNLVGVSPLCVPGIVYGSRQILQFAIIGLGFGLSLDQVADTGGASLAVTLVTLSVAFLAAWALGRLLGVSGRLRLLIGVGTAICGGSAIAATAPIIRADHQETALAVSTIFLFNVVAVLLFPFLGHALGLSDAGFGLWAGTAINDTSSVVAAGYSYSAAAGDIATVVKLTRATLIIPVCLILAAWVAWRARHDAVRPSLLRIFPWFIAGFLAASAAHTAGWVPPALLGPLHQAAQFLIVMALTAIGLSSDLRGMARAGLRPVVLGLGVWGAVALSSLGMQVLVGIL